MFRTLLLIIAFMFCVNMARANECKLKQKICAESDITRVIDGKSVSKECWRYVLKYDCISQEYQDYCKVISTTPGCNQINSECLEKLDNGECYKFKNIYQCGNLLQKAEQTKFIDSEYTVAKDELDNSQCNSNEIDANCQEVANVCVGGAETRNINGKNIYKDCWRYEKKYQCFSGSLISDCDDYKGCKLIDEKCISYNKSKECIHKEKKFECIELSGTKPTTLNCTSGQYCIGGNCEEAKYEPNKNLDKAISGLSILNTLKNDFDSENCNKEQGGSCKVFKGDANFCEINILNSLNCCKDKGWLKDIGFGSCNATEKKLAKQKEARLCHYVGSYCADKILGFCTEKKQSYCCFGSKISRIIHEYGRSQLGIGWGAADAPDCRALTISELQRIDFSKVDLSELFGEINAKAAANVSRVNVAKDISEKKVKEEAFKRLQDSGVPVTSMTNKDYQNEVSRRVRQHYGN